MRGPELEQDKTLRPDTHSWLALLAEADQPNELCSTYPRIANRFAMIWADRPAMKSYFDDLLDDRRGGRIGFSPGIKDEIAQLRRHYETEMSDAHAVQRWRNRMAERS